VFESIPTSSKAGGDVHEMAPALFMKPTVGGGDESLTLRYPSK